MKKFVLTSSHLRAANKRFKRRLISKAKKLEQRQCMSGQLDHFSNHTFMPRLIAPKEICVYSVKSQNILVKFLKNLRFMTITSNRRVRVDLSNITKCGASGTLLFLAEIDRIYHITKRTDLLQGVGKTSNKVSQVFKQVGLDKRLNIRLSAKIEREDVKHWKHITGIGTTGQELGEMLENLKEKIGTDIVREVYGAYVDAIDNVSSHAYVEKRYENDEFDESRWWVFAQIRDGHFVTAACDLGMGIPRSVPTKGRLEEIGAQLSSYGLTYSDKNLIKVAFELNRTSTAQKKHGKGLHKMRSLIDKFNYGSLSIYSNSGVYRYSANKNSKNTETRTAKSIMGTIVEWNIPINVQLSADQR